MASVVEYDSDGDGSYDGINGEKPAPHHPSLNYFFQCLEDEECVAQSTVTKVPTDGFRCCPLTQLHTIESFRNSVIMDMDSVGSLGDLESIISELCALEAELSVKEPLQQTASGHRKRPPTSSAMSSCCHSIAPDCANSSESSHMPKGSLAVQADGSAVKISEEKILMAMQKIKDADIKKLFVKVFIQNGDSKTLALGEGMTAFDTIKVMFEKCSTFKPNIRWTIVEQLPALMMERIIEDHERLVPLMLSWNKVSDNRVLFLEAEDKYDLFFQPQNYLLDKRDAAHCVDEACQRALLNEMFGHLGCQVPDLEGDIYIKIDSQKSWRKITAVMRSSGIYAKKSKSSRNLHSIVQLDQMEVYRGFGWKKKYKAPTEFGFAVKHATVQCKSKEIKYFCCDDEDTLKKWLIGIRVAKHGNIMQENFKRMLDLVTGSSVDVKNQRLSAAEKSPPSSHSSRGSRDSGCSVTSDVCSLDTCALALAKGFDEDVEHLPPPPAEFCDLPPPPPELLSSGYDGLPSFSEAGIQDGILGGTCDAGRLTHNPTYCGMLLQPMPQDADRTLRHLPQLPSTDASMSGQCSKSTNEIHYYSLPSTTRAFSTELEKQDKLYEGHRTYDAPSWNEPPAAAWVTMTDETDRGNASFVLSPPPLPPPPPPPPAHFLSQNSVQRHASAPTRQLRPLVAQNSLPAVATIGTGECLQKNAKLGFLVELNSVYAKKGIKATTEKSHCPLLRHEATAPSACKGQMTCNAGKDEDEQELPPPPPPEQLMLPPLLDCGIAMPAVAGTFEGAAPVGRATSGQSGAASEWTATDNVTNSVTSSLSRTGTVKRMPPPPPKRQDLEGSRLHVTVQQPRLTAAPGGRC